MIDILKYLILSTEVLVPIMIFFGFLLALAEFSKLKYTKLILWLSFILGTILGLLQIIIKSTDAKKLNVLFININRYNLAIVSLLFTVVLLLVILRQFTDVKILKLIHFVMANILLIFMLSNSMKVAIEFTTEFVYFGEQTITTMSILRASGFILGSLIAIVFLISILKVSLSIPYKIFKLFYLLNVIVFSIYYIPSGIYALGKLKIVTFSVFKIRVFNDSYYAVYSFILVALAVLMLIYAILTNIKIKGEYANKALVRIEKARLRRNRRWSTFLAFLCVCTVMIATVVKYYETKEVELSPPEPYQVEGDDIVIPITSVNDGHLHRFMLEGKKGKEIKFLIVKKPNGNAYGLGLDACEICGTAGYYERDDEVVCKRCDVVMNKATIGFHGGCNPIPFDYMIKNGKIIISKQTLYDKEDVFR